MNNLTRRIEQLEGAAGIHDAPTCFVITDYPEEPANAAVARYRAEHPETPDHARFVVFVSGFSARPAV
jgi:hypothetical protein